MDIQFKIRDKRGPMNIKEMRDVLNMLIEAGFADYDIRIGCSSNCNLTTIYADDIWIYKDTKIICFYEV